MDSKNKKSFYITTTLPYVNSDPHVGFAMEIVRADVIARYREQCGYDVFFNTGTDEHGLKIYRKALENNVDPQKYVDEWASKFVGLKDLLNLSPQLHYIRTTNEHHKTAAQAFWNICNQNGYIYKKKYKVKYCVGCELEKTESELVDGKCAIHPNLELEIIDEENYFFKFSAFQKQLLDFYKANPSFVIPDFRFNEIKAFVERGLEDFSISRLKSKMSWGVSVPNDPDHVMYVWFDALVNYISTLGWPEDTATFKKYWQEGNPVQYCGKDNLRQQSAMWQAMLMAAGLPQSQTIVINGFITSAGQKMSKSLGNVISPYDVIKEFGADAFRYFVIRELSTFEDGDFTMERFKEAYNTGLANGLGNLASRIMKMAETNLEKAIEVKNIPLSQEFTKALDIFELKHAADFIWKEIAAADVLIQETQPFKLIKEKPEEAKNIISDLVARLYNIADMLAPILPDASSKIKTAVEQNKMPEPLFQRK